MNDSLTFAVPKGRILDEALPVMARAGVVPEDAFHDKANRSLTFATTRNDMRLIRVRAFDVATFVAHGAAQMGIVGSDVIEESCPFILFLKPALTGTSPLSTLRITTLALLIIL